jgi:hypothetical protein
MRAGNAIVLVLVNLIATTGNLPHADEGMEKTATEEGASLGLLLVLAPAMVHRQHHHRHQHQNLVVADAVSFKVPVLWFEVDVIAFSTRAAIAFFLYCMSFLLKLRQLPCFSEVIMLYLLSTYLSLWQSDWSFW